MTHTETQRGRQCTEPLEDTRQLRSNTSQATAPLGGHPVVSGNGGNLRRCTRGRRGNAALTLVRHVPGCAEAATERAARADDHSADRGKPGSRRGAHHHRNRHQAGATCATVASAHAARRGKRFTTKERRRWGTIGGAGKDSARARMRSAAWTAGWGLSGGGASQLRVDGVQPQKLWKKIFEPVVALTHAGHLLGTMVEYSLGCALSSQTFRISRMWRVRPSRLGAC